MACSVTLDNGNKVDATNQHQQRGNANTKKTTVHLDRVYSIWGAPCNEVLKTKIV